MRYISGETLQEMAGIYLGNDEDFAWNPRIAQQSWKHCRLADMGPRALDNPPIVFCYTHRLATLAEKVAYLANPFVLITHNSDGEVRQDDPAVAALLACPRLVAWFAQNLCFRHPKLQFLPIGAANMQWEHGLEFFRWFYGPAISSAKTRDVYMCFEVATCPSERRPCMERLSGKVPLLEKVPPAANLRRMEEYRFVICPAGNGVDTHRFWECLYLRCVPVVVRNPLVDILRKETRLPMVVLESWDDFSPERLPDYAGFDFECPELYLDYYETEISVAAAAAAHR